MNMAWANSLFTIGICISFAVILFIVLNKRNKQNYQDAAQSIFDDDDAPSDSEATQTHREHGA